MAGRSLSMSDRVWERAALCGVAAGFSPPFHFRRAEARRSTYLRPDPSSQRHSPTRLIANANRGGAQIDRCAVPAAGEAPALLWHRVLTA
jgi:hypothetical protein